MLAYASPFLLLASVPLFFVFVGAAGPLLTIGLLLLALIGSEAISARGHVPRPAGSTQLYQLLPMIYVVAQLAVTLWAIATAAHASVLGFISLVFAIGVTTGVFGILCAHELVHGKGRLSHAFGTLMLTAMCYRHFRVAHIYGHHRYAGTARDCATARMGESFYAFLLRTVSGQWWEAWQHEQIRVRRSNESVLANRVFGDGAVMLAIFVLLYLAGGWRGPVFLLSESAVGVIVLELFNYIAHYGLVRRVDARGRTEPFGEAHSWNSSNVIANTIIFNMGRHSDHHKRPSISYEELRYLSSAPELPAGYAGSILLAAIPPLWRRVMDPAVRALDSSRA
ncbi:MAG: alkane 1-monooxygenase [Proteobacteria bacterium]|nr:alkane 1-monooxygenase [Pseudomonadota bacterium]